MKQIPVIGHKNLVRDANTGAIININKKSIKDARAAKELRLAQKDEINDLKSDVVRIKEILEKLLANT